MPVKKKKNNNNETYNDDPYTFIRNMQDKNRNVSLLDMTTNSIVVGMQIFFRFINKISNNAFLRPTELH